MNPVVITIVVIFFLWVMKCLNVLREYERAVTFAWADFWQRIKGRG